MRAIRVNEAQNFERGQEPKKSMKIGHNRFDSMYEYMDYLVEERGEDPEDFWSIFWNITRDQKGSDIMEELLEALKYTPAEYQTKWANDTLEWWDDFKNY